MADVRPRFDLHGRGRAQVLVIGAVLLAMLFVGFALVLNASIFAENLATRQGGAVNADIQGFRNAGVAGVGTAIATANRVGAGASFATLRDSYYQPRVERLAQRLASGRALSGAAVGLSTVESWAGTQLVDDDASSTLTPRGDTPVDWTMVRAAHVRAFDLTAEPTASDSTSEVTDQLTGGSGEAFVVTLTPAVGAAYQVAVYEDSDISDTAVRVAVSEVGSSVVRECDATGAAATLSLTGRPTVDGEYCDPLAPVADASGTYAVTVDNGDRVVGTYRLVVDRTDGPSAAAVSLDEQVDRANYGTACQGTTYADDTTADPHSVPAIYAGTIDLRYRSQRAETESTVRVAPEQAGGALVAPRVASLSVVDSSADGDASFTVDWTVEDPNADLSEVTVTVENVDDGETLTESVTVSGEEASGSRSFTDTDDGGETYRFTITVTDGTHARSRTVTHAADGETSGCPL